jgi:hypothetical protein
MHPNIKRFLEQATERITTAAAETVEQLAKEGAVILSQEFDSRRTETRRAARWRKLGELSAEVGLFFPRRYTRNKNAFTYKEFERIVRTRLRPQLRSNLGKILNNKLQR